MRTQLVTIALATLCTLVGDSAAAPEPGTVTGKVKVKAKGTNRKDHAGVVVYLEGVPTTPGKQKNIAVRQKDKQFDPPLTIVVRGTTVDFPNEDKIFHNVFSVSRPARFDLGLYKSGTMKSVELKRAGVVDVYCNIHPDMVAKVKVLENAYYTVTGKDGTFKIENVPAGEYPIIAWMQTGDEAKGTVKVSAGGSAEVKLDVSEVAKKKTHTRKDGTPYGRYK
jgi:plastocyanin